MAKYTPNKKSCIIHTTRFLKIYLAIFQYYDQKGKIIGVSLCLRFAKL